MRYNEKELRALSRQPAELAAELGMRGPKKGSGEWAGPGRLAGGFAAALSRAEPALCSQWPSGGW